MPATAPAPVPTLDELRAVSKDANCYFKVSRVGVGTKFFLKCPLLHALAEELAHGETDGPRFFIPGASSLPPIFRADGLPGEIRSLFLMRDLDVGAEIVAQRPMTYGKAKELARLVHDLIARTVADYTTSFSVTVEMRFDAPILRSVPDASAMLPG